MEQELYHYGILGMKWGIRRYQNPDGSLTPAGRKRYSGLGARKRFNKDTSQIETRLNKLKWKKEQTKETAEEIEFLENALKGLRQLEGTPPALIRRGSNYVAKAQMNWSQKTSSSVASTPVDSASISDDEERFRDLMRKNPSQLSTQELNFINTRIQAKNMYRSNTESPASKFLRTAASQVASQLAAEYMKAGAKKLIGWSGKKVSNFASRKSRKDQAWEDLLNNMKNRGGSNNADNTTENNAKDKKKGK